MPASSRILHLNRSPRSSVNLSRKLPSRHERCLEAAAMVEIDKWGNLVTED